jgi:hypothetical protein|tara:strand:- start:559 stop:1203 length:645 start_codon:yes stop_codon:yes gene_type:complete
MATGNSQEVSYGFGQLGSAHIKTGTSLIPPKGMVIIAIQFLEGNTLAKLVSESDRAGLPNFIDTVSTSNMNFGGYHKSDIANGNIAQGSVITVTANKKINIGDPVLLVGNAANDTAATGIVNFVPTVTPVPNYEEYNDYVKVESVNAAGTGVTLSHALGATTNKALIFLNETSGAGGTTAAAVSYPMGMIIYGRWTMVEPAAQVNGGIIAYFGY